jgi:hypothetical protein
MAKLRVLLVAAALLTAACGAATISSSPLESVSNAGNVRVNAAANAATDVATGTADDLSRPNPQVRKGTPLAPQQSMQRATTDNQPSSSASDRCSAGFSGSTVGSTAGSSAKHPPLPECPVE